MKQEALIIDIQRLSTEDGPGVRTTVFFKGCTLRCAWCHNPESLEPYMQNEWYKDRCMGCGICVSTCPHHGLEMTPEGLKIDPSKCEHCNSCIRNCPTNALAVKGERWHVDDLVHEVLKDRAYFGPDGGITTSGGEALMQSEFIKEFYIRLKNAGVHTALDTAAHVKWDAFERVLPYTDLVLLDLKIMDSQKHKEWIGPGNELILENAQKLAAYIKEHDGRPELWIRTPMIPRATALDENVASIGKFIKEKLGGVETKWELCAFNNLGKDKYTRLNMEYAFKDDPLMTKQEMEHLHAIACESRGEGGNVIWSGATRVEA